MDARRTQANGSGSGPSPKTNETSPPPPKSPGSSAKAPANAVNVLFQPRYWAVRRGRLRGSGYQGLSKKGARGFLSVLLRLILVGGRRFRRSRCRFLDIADFDCVGTSQVGILNTGLMVIGWPFRGGSYVFVDQLESSSAYIYVEFYFLTVDFALTRR